MSIDRNAVDGSVAAIDPHDWRLVAFAIPVWGVLFAVTSGASWAPGAVFGVVAAVMVGVVARPIPLTMAVLGVTVVAAGLGGVRVDALHGGPVAEAAAAHLTAHVEFEVATDGRALPHGVIMEGRLVALQVDRSHWRGGLPVRILAQGRELTGYPLGTQLAATARLSPPRPDEPRAAIVRVTGPLRVRGSPGPGLALVNTVRAGLRTAVADLPPRQRGLVPALVLGDVSQLTPVVEQDFKRTGLMHLVAVSGANLAILLTFLLVVARWIGVRGIGLPVVTAVGIVVFVALCRGEPSVFRAATMGVITMIAVSTVGGRRPQSRQRGLQYLALAVMVLLIADPWLSRSVGFGLSVAASAGIVVFAAPWARRMRWLPGAELVTVPLAAQLVTQPLVTAISEQVSLVGVVANVAAGWLVAPATVVGFAAAGATLVHPEAARLLAHLAGWGVDGIATIAENAAAVPLAAVSWPARGMGLVLLTGLCAAVVALLPWVLQRWWLCLLMTLVTVVALGGVGLGHSSDGVVW